MIPKFLVDGWQNFLTGLGVGGSKNENTRWVAGNNFIDYETGASIYSAGGVGARIVDKYSKGMTREWFRISPDHKDLILDKLNYLEAKDRIEELVKWARVFGGAVILIGIKDGRQLQSPVNENFIQSVDYLHVFDRKYITIESQQYYTDINSPKFGTPKIYKIEGSFIPNQRSADKMTFLVHESRILRMDGIKLTRQDEIANQGWGSSIYNKVFKSLRRYDSAMEYTNEILHDFVTSVYSVDNLAEILSSKEGEAALINRIRTSNQCRSTLNALIKDNDENFSKETTNTTGIVDIIDRFILDFCAAAEIPRIVLMNDSPSGLNATGEADVRGWYDQLKSDQVDVLEPVLRKLIRYIILAKEMPANINALENKKWEIKFNPLWQPTQEQLIDNRFKQAQTDQINIANGITDPTEVRTSRFGGDDYSFETSLDKDITKSMDEDLEEDDEPLPPQIPQELNNGEQSPSNAADNPIAQNGGNTPPQA